MTDYVVGFLHDTKRVALVEKIKPIWQAGKLNGIGGKIEIDEFAYQAMQREFMEEAGLNVLGWRHFLTVTSGEHRIYFFVKRVHRNVLNRVRTMEAEEIVVKKVKKLKYDKCIPNLEWILPLALHRQDEYHIINVVER